MEERLQQGQPLIGRAGGGTVGVCFFCGKETVVGTGCFPGGIAGWTVLSGDEKIGGVQLVAIAGQQLLRELYFVAVHGIICGSLLNTVPCRIVLRPPTMQTCPAGTVRLVYKADGEASLSAMYPDLHPRHKGRGVSTLCNNAHRILTYYPIL